ncbi:hypothetical protein F383_30403 [Gossypium arboreum]|uniref:Uncharacterized protein n=1 Tax=Gossypium arboreum TaxID=29729 RepID=A0A0B0PNJ8_GOSAR|nr:hypothetical protein F383_30403 [Gossypium arboreum]
MPVCDYSSPWSRLLNRHRRVRHGRVRKSRPC